MASIAETAIDLSSVGAGIVFGLGLVVGLGGMWLAWRLVRSLPPDESDRERPDKPDEPDGET